MLNLGRIYPKWFHALKNMKPRRKGVWPLWERDVASQKCVLFAENYTFFCSNCAFKRIPLPVSLYFWSRCFGLSGMVISINPACRAGDRYLSTKFRLSARPNEA